MPSIYSIWWYCMISANSPKKRISLPALPNGQYLRRPSINGAISEASLTIKSMAQRTSFSKKLAHDCTLCRGMIISLKKVTCSALRGTAYPDIIDAYMSRSSPAPFWQSVSWISLKKLAFTTERIIFRRATTFAYSLCNTCFKKSRSCSSSESNSSTKLCTNFVLMNFLTTFYSI